MKLTLGFSPCPNDTFIFDALVNHKTETGELDFDVVLEDVETLNEWALAGKLDITKISYGVLPLVTSNYAVLNSGSALGKGVGPLLIRPAQSGFNPVEEQTVAIPGEHTTAHLLFSLAYPRAKKKVFIRYDAIEDFVLEGKGLGVIIHENRFTYAAKGLAKITDLGDFWEQQTGNAIPLGGIVTRRDIDTTVAMKVDNLIRKSIDYAYRNHYTELAGYVKKHAREMSETVMRKHIDLYVNNHSLQLGPEGKKAVMELLKIYQNIHPGNPFKADAVFLPTAD